MKQTTKMSRAVGQLEKIYNCLNEDFFDGALPVPIITVQSKPGTMGHCSVAKVWQRPDGNTYELNITAEVLNYPIEDTLDTMIHEMVHLYCRENDIKETSRGGKYHNGRFKAEAEKRGLECYQCGQYGWNTRPTDKLIEYAMDKGWNEIDLDMVMALKLEEITDTGFKHLIVPVVPDHSHLIQQEQRSGLWNEIAQVLDIEMSDTGHKQFFHIGINPPTLFKMLLGQFYKISGFTGTLLTKDKKKLIRVQVLTGSKIPSTAKGHKGQKNSH